MSIVEFAERVLGYTFSPAMAAEIEGYFKGSTVPYINTDRRNYLRVINAYKAFFEID
ncbi:hypothetical protein GJ688_09280 [Heliobacillus mobilis]|uniref:Uncharacterized protein n=1 Tax=Heliobacterium mobile TaxID=28064 RepID=A0A6I3SJU8_HELMO|nr:hypothetical protein [Heliobacterium mobile]MTV49169.1 hypothetical protein [Heliobacterium mobile]